MIVVQGGIVESVITDIKGKQFELFIVDKDKDLGTSITTMLSEHRENINNKRCIHLYEDAKKRIGEGLVVTNTNGHEFMATLREVHQHAEYDVPEENYEQFYLTVEDQHGDLLDVNYEQVTFD